MNQSVMRYDDTGGVEITRLVDGKIVEVISPIKNKPAATELIDDIQVVADSVKKTRRKVDDV